MMRRTILLLATMTLAVLAAGGVALGVTQKFSKPAQIVIPSIGTADPYPSQKRVSGLPSDIRDVNLTLRGFKHEYPDDVAVLLVGPDDQSALVMSDVGGFLDVAGVRLILDDEATASIPDNDTMLTDGRYKPTQGTVQGGVDNNPVPTNFPPPAPPEPYGMTLSVFDGTDPNGTWKLYVLDDTDGDVGSFVRGWALRIIAS